ncbi:MAG: ABC transporter ATP-binding protein [Planctomycetota bacterium]|nr:MAG: ABC transporter ATP-binding protein [Planctomycetota bacterium]
MARPFERALRYFPKVRRRWLWGMAAVPLASGLPLAVISIVGHVVDGIDPTQGAGDAAGGGAGLGAGSGASMSPFDAAGWGGLILLLVLVAAAAKFAMRYCITGASRDFERIYRQDLFAHLMSLSPRDLSGVRTGDIMSRSVADIEAVRMLLGPAVMYNAQAIVVVPTALTLMGLLDPLLMAVMLIPFVGLALVIKVAARPTQRWSQAAQEHLADVSIAAQEGFSGIRVLKASTAEPRAGALFRRMGRKLYDANLALATLRGVTSAAITAVKELGVLAILVLGGWHVVQGQLTSGQLLQFIMLLGFALWPLIAIGWMLGMWHRAVTGYNRLEELFSIAPSVDRASDPVRTEPLRGELSVSGLTFAWDDQPVLHDISFELPAGGSLGITGRTGCGKSTLVQLVSRLVEPPAGSVRLDGHDVRLLDPASLRRAVSVVPQDTFLFSDSIRNNIAFAGDHINDEGVQRAAKLARLHEDIQGFSDGYEQLLGERGVTLSGGQRQRTAIARALAADPSVIVLDDCLSAVDSVTEQEILANLRRTLEGRTAIIVSHRVNALRLADQILVLDEGRIIERGSHAELLAAGGLYAEIAERQRIEEELEAL